MTAIRSLGSWDGDGSRTIGFNSESGRFRVTWETRNAAADSAFRLTVHSAVSGRPIRDIADHRGAGRGVVDVDDDPRPYNFMVDSHGLEWTIGVEEFVATRR